MHDARSDDKVVHVSNMGKAHPPPCLTCSLPSDHPAAHEALWPQLTALTSRLLGAARADLIPTHRCPRSTLFSVLALDLALDADNRPWLLEVNSHCAIGDGTMSAVDPEVYSTLVADVVTSIVLPALTPDDASPDGKRPGPLAIGRLEPLAW